MSDNKLNDDLESNSVLPRCETGLPGIDALTRGGFPQGRSTLICGSAGSGKTVFATQFLVEGVRHYDEPGVFVAFEEPPEDIHHNMLGFGWDLEKKVNAGQLVFVDGSPRPEEEDLFSGGDYDLAGLRSRVKHAIEKIGAKRVSIDSLASLLHRFPNSGIMRREMFKLTQMLRDLGVTSLITSERLHERGGISRFGIEEYVVNSVIILRNLADTARRRRTIEILKMRGGAHSTGEFPFALSKRGIQAIPLGTIALAQPSTDRRISSGVDELNKMCGGGFFRDAVAIVSGATGTGKTLTSMHFIAGAAAEKDRAALFAFEESRPQLLRNAESWGIDLEKMEKEGLVKIFCQFPESGSLEDHLTQIRRVLAEFKPARIVIDSISAMQRIASDSSFREFVIALTSIMKEQQVAALYTTTSEQLIGSKNVTGQHISTLTDTIIMLRYVESQARMHRGITVLKMRGSMHDKSIRGFSITDEGMVIGGPLRGLSNIVGGSGMIASIEPEDD